MSIKYFQQSAEQLSSAYSSALKLYLAEYTEDALRQAYELGREALRANLGILDMTEMHHQAVKTALQNTAPQHMDQQIKNSMTFFEESLSPFEITHRGYRDAVEIIRRVANFSFMASHEIKTPLTSIQSSANMLDELLSANRDSVERRLLANIINGANILRSRADDVMDIVGLYTGALSIKMAPVNLPEFLLQVFERLDPEVRSQGMQLSLCSSADLPQVRFDPQRIEQVIANLVQNAVKYAADGGYIELKATTDKDYLIVTVEDWGRGLPLYEQEMLLFADRPIERDTQAQGTGLGLMLCRQIIESHNGTMRLINHKGQGSIFEIRLPLEHTY